MRRGIWTSNARDYSSTLLHHATPPRDTVEWRGEEGRKRRTEEERSAGEERVGRERKRDRGKEREEKKEGR